VTTFTKAFLRKAIEELEQELALMRARLIVWEDLCATTSHNDYEMTKRATNLYVFYAGARDRFGYGENFEEWLERIFPTQSSLWLARFSLGLPISISKDVCAQS